MGKAANRKKERKTAPEGDGVMVDKTLNDEAVSQGRRTWVKGLVAGGALATGGGWIAHEYKQGEARDNAPVNGEISVNEALDIYRRLEQRVSAAHKAAQKESKPLRIAVLENHSSPTAIAYQLMVTKIAGKLGIKQLFVEAANQVDKIDQSGVQELANEQGIYKKLLFTSARRNGLTDIHEIDTLFADEEQYRMRYFIESRKLMEEQLKQRYPGRNPLFTVFPVENSASRDITFNYKISGIPPYDEEAMNGVVRKATEQAMANIHIAREDEMVRNLMKSQDAMVVMGGKHGMRVMSQLQAQGGTHLVINTITRDSIEPKAMKPGDVEKLAWAFNPENALQHTGRNFPQSGLFELVEQAAAKAASWRGLLR